MDTSLPGTEYAGNDYFRRLDPHRYLHRETAAIHGSLHLGAVDASSLPLRPTNGFGLETISPACATQHRDHSRIPVDHQLELETNTMIIQRKELSWWERLYLPAILSGFRVTLKGNSEPVVEAVIEESDYRTNG